MLCFHLMGEVPWMNGRAIWSLGRDAAYRP